MKCRKISIGKIISVIAIMVLLFTSGGNYFIRNIGFLMGVAVLLLIYYKKLSAKHIWTFLIISIYVLLNSIVFNIAPTNKKECLILIIRLFGCMVIASNITWEKFKKIFLYIMLGLSILSLSCFLCMMLHIPLPGVGLHDGIYGSFYHTLSIGTGWQLERCRNSGVFTEPGIFQIYLNIALLILWSNREMPLGKAKKIFWLLSITMLTTKSSMGLLIWGIVLLLFFIDRREILPHIGGLTKRRVRVRMVLFAIVLLIVEEVTLGVGKDMIQNVNSWASRHDDTILTFLMAKDYPVFGIGIATDPIPIWDVYYEKYSALRLYTSYQNARSNGLGNCLAGAGIPFTILYLYCIIKSYFQMLNVKKKLSKIILTITFILFFMEEPIMFTPFFLICFYWVNVKKKKVYKTSEEQKYEQIMDNTLYSCKAD